MSEDRLGGFIFEDGGESVWEWGMMLNYSC